MLFSLLLALAQPAGLDLPQQWPAFRGTGHNLSAKSHVPTQWSPEQNIAWRKSLPGYGQSSPVVWGNRVFLTSIEGEAKERLLITALDVTSGARLWSKEFTASQKGKNNPMMSRAAPTPVVDAHGVYCFFESGDAIALSHTGDKHWQRSLTVSYGEFKNNHGLGSSLAQTDRALIALVDHAGPSYLVALEKSTGETLWKTDRPSRTSWTSPVVAEVAGRPVVLASSTGSLAAYDARTGAELANYEGLVGNAIPSPTSHGTFVLIGAGENRMKPDLQASTRSNCCLKLIQKGEGHAWEVVWQSSKIISGTASPLVHQGYAYFVSKTGFVHCLDLESGKECYAERLDSIPWASPVALGEHLYFFGKDGTTTVLKTGPEYEVLATNRLWSKDEFARRQEQAKQQAQTSLPKPPEGRGPGGGPPLPKEELEATRYSAVGDVVYGVAMVENTILLRTGTELIAIRSTGPAPVSGE